MSRFELLRERFPMASAETIYNYIDLREEGYPQHQALLMAGLSDPPEDDEPSPDDDS